MLGKEGGWARHFHLAKGTGRGKGDLQLFSPGPRPRRDIPQRTFLAGAEHVSRGAADRGSARLCTRHVHPHTKQIREAAGLIERESGPVLLRSATEC